VGERRRTAAADRPRRREIRASRSERGQKPGARNHGRAVRQVQARWRQIS